MNKTLDKLALVFLVVFFHYETAKGETETTSASTNEFKDACLWHELTSNADYRRNGVQMTMWTSALHASAVSGNWATWGAWGTCSVTCGGGTQTRTRACTNPAPSGGGSDCPGSSSGSQYCNGDACPVNGNWATWSSWGSCSVTCGGGSQERTRTCSNPTPSGGGTDCSGSTTDSQTCSTAACPVNGNWVAWSSWGNCSVTCGGGTKTRTRTCSNPAPSSGGANCSGSASDSLPCSTAPCPVNGNWTVWGVWNTCSHSCGQGVHVRARSCTSPSPVNGGSNCLGSAVEYEGCSEAVCSSAGKYEPVRSMLLIISGSLAIWMKTI